MIDASDENTENKFGEENEENEQFLRQKGHRKCRSHALAYRNTNVGGSVSEERKVLQEKDIYGSISKRFLLHDRRKHENFQQRNQGPPTKNRWLPTRISTFNVYCDSDGNDQKAGSSRDFEKSGRRQEEGSKRSGDMSAQDLQVPAKIRRPLAALSPNQRDSDSDSSKSFANLSHEESDSEDSTSSDTNRESVEDEISSSDRIDMHADELDPLGEMAPNVAPNNSSQAASASSSIVYTTEEHEDRVRMDPIYDADVYFYMRCMELQLCPFAHYLELQEEICGEVRYILIEWMCDSAREFNLSTECLHMAVSIVDRVLNTLQCPREKLQLLGAAALLLASKFEEIYPPEVKEFVRITAYSFHETEILRMERIVFARVEYQLLAPTSWWFASRLIRVARVPRKMYCMTRYLLELTLLDPAFLGFRPSVIGAASFFLTSVIFKIDYRLSVIQTGIGLDQLRLPARKMLKLFHQIRRKNYCSVFEKYATERYEEVACLLIPKKFTELDVPH